MNYMADVAKILGVELGEEFKLSDYPETFILTERGLEFLYHGKWSLISGSLNDLLSGCRNIIKIPKPILDDVEKKYLSKFIRPFKERVKYIAKLDVKDIEDEMEYILIIYKEFYGTFRPRLMELPTFKKGTMYKGMTLGRSEEHTSELQSQR